MDMQIPYGPHAAHESRAVDPVDRATVEALRHLQRVVAGSGVTLSIIPDKAHVEATFTLHPQDELAVAQLQVTELAPMTDALRVVRRFLRPLDPPRADLPAASAVSHPLAMEPQQ